MNKFGKQLDKFSSGAALIIAMLVVTAVSGIAFYASRLTIKELVVMNRQEDSLDAYYLAETGIEEGLLLWRINHDVEISRECPVMGQCDSKNAPTEKSGNPVEVKLSDNESYNLKIWHRNDTGISEQGIIGKDETYEYDISNLNTLTLTCDPASCPTSGNTYEFALEYYVVTLNNSVGDKGMLCVGCPLTNTRPIDLTNAEKLRIRAWGSTKNYTLSSAGANLDSRYTTVESTGFFGNTQRKLQIKIDRQSGKAYGIFDYMLFGGSATGIGIHD